MINELILRRGLMSTRNVSIDWETIARGMIDGTTQFTIDENVANALQITDIGNRIFYYRANLTGDVILPPSLTAIGGSEIFAGCANLKSVTIGENVASIKNSAFNSIGTSIKALIINRETPPTLSGSYALSGTSQCIIYVPDSAVDTYKAAQYWSEYASRIKGISELPTT